MKKLIITFLLIALTLPSLNAKQASDEYKIMTCNIRITGLEDDAPYPERVWDDGSGPGNDALR